MELYSRHELEYCRSTLWSFEAVTYELLKFADTDSLYCLSAFNALQNIWDLFNSLIAVITERIATTMTISRPYRLKLIDKFKVLDLEKQLILTRLQKRIFSDCHTFLQICHRLPINRNICSCIAKHMPYSRLFLCDNAVLDTSNSRRLQALFVRNAVVCNDA